MKENSELKPVKLRLKIDHIPHSVCAGVVWLIQTNEYAIKQESQPIRQPKKVQESFLSYKLLKSGN